MEKDHLTPEEVSDLDEIMRMIDMPLPENTNPEPGVESLPENPSAPTEDAGKQGNNQAIFQKSIVMYLHDLAYLLIGIVLVFLLCFRIVVVSGDSMYGTLVDGDYLLLSSNLFYLEPKAGDIIVASKADYDNGMPIVKRVIATEGQVVDIDFIAGTVSVDGEILQEDYVYSKTTLEEGVAFPLTVDEGCVFVLGDNRNRSKDSRDPEIGLIDHRQIVGKVILLLVPGDDKGNGQRDFDRIGVID